MMRENNKKLEDLRETENQLILKNLENEKLLTFIKEKEFEILKLKES